jgi:hypothetical protein
MVSCTKWECVCAAWVEWVVDHPLPAVDAWPRRYLHRKATSDIDAAFGKYVRYYGQG